ncbi:MAG: hypothetical protein Q8L11_01405 [Candidatus Moranbacteria bacterium]|nr:hypothetical protein [Candidatus Moranbacteria bacterium]
MNHKLTIFIFFLATLLLLSAPSLKAAGKSSTSIGISLTVEAYIKCTVSGDEMTIMTNSYQPVFILEDAQALPDKAVFGQLAVIKIKQDSVYTILSEI